MNTAHADVFDRRESLRGPLLGSVLLHACIAGAVVAYTLYVSMHPSESFGANTLLSGGSVQISAVEALPLPNRKGLLNPLAHETESHVPAPMPKPKETRRKPLEDPRAIALKTPDKPRRPEPDSTAARYHPQPVQPNQVVSTEAQALVSPMLNLPGSGGVGVGSNSSMGNRFGWYVDLIKQRIAQKWRTNEVGLQSAPVVIVAFDITHDGGILPPKIMQRSGNYTLDTSTVRAIAEAAPFPPLPAGYSGPSASFEIWFQLKR